MATLSFASWQYYNISGATLTSQFPGGYGTVPSTVTENADVDSFLRPGEQVFDDWGSGGATYNGLLTVGGHTFMYFTDGIGHFLAPVPQEGDLPQSDFPLSFDLSSVQSSPADTVFMCFAAGTLIATPSGEVAVETLKIGDSVLTARGRTVPVKWLGRQTVVAIFSPAERLMPVRIEAGALGYGLPHSDLTVTADHAMLVDGVLCHAGALVNGTTITRVPLSEMGETYTVYHVETEEHEIILANGAPAETFIDNVSRRAFDNFAEFAALYGDVPEMVELPLPRAMSARQLPGHIRRKLAVAKVA